MIEKFILSISKHIKEEYFPVEKIITDYIFTGDGAGDFEKHSDNASEKAVRNYIEYCQEQIKIAGEYYHKKFLLNKQKK
jgi:hypothetical protein